MLLSNLQCQQYVFNPNRLIDISSDMFFEPNALTKVKDNAPMISLQNSEPPVAKKKKSNKLNRNDLDPLIKKSFAKSFEPMLIHRIASLTPSWYPRGSPPNVWLVPTASMLQTEYDAIVKQETNVAHAVRAGNAVFSCVRGNLGLFYFVLIFIISRLVQHCTITEDPCT